MTDELTPSPVRRDLQLRIAFVLAPDGLVADWLLRDKSWPADKWVLYAHLVYLYN